jgi:predicted RNA-binding protein
MLDPYWEEFDRIMNLNDYVELEYPENSEIYWTDRWENYFSSGGTVNYYQSNNKGVIIIRSEYKKNKETGVWTARALLDIQPTMHFVNDQTKELFSLKPLNDEEIVFYRAKIRKLKIYENGIEMDVYYDNDNSTDEHIYYFDLLDGMYFETDNNLNMRNTLSEYDFYQKDAIFRHIPNEKPREPWFRWFDLKRLDKNGKYLETILQDIWYFKENGQELWLISAYGSYIFSYETENIKLVNTEQFEDNNFYYYSYKSSYRVTHGKIDFNTIVPSNIKRKIGFY